MDFAAIRQMRRLMITDSSGFFKQLLTSSSKADGSRVASVMWTLPTPIALITYSIITFEASPVHAGPGNLPSAAHLSHRQWAGEAIISIQAYASASIQLRQLYLPLLL
jgi:hypothetical protein